MQRLVGYLLCALVAVAANVNAPGLTPAQEVGQTLTLPYDASLQEGPSDDALSLRMVSAGTTISLSGEPAGNYYPVEVDGTSGWIRGDALTMSEGAASPEKSSFVSATPSAPLESVDNAPELLETETSSTESWDPVATPASDTSMVAEPVSNLHPNAPTVAVSDPGPTGPAQVTTRADIFAGPGPEYGVLGTARAGDLVEQTGHQIAGYVTVRHIGVTGWILIDLLGPPASAIN